MIKVTIQEVDVIEQLFTNLVNNINQTKELVINKLRQVSIKDFDENQMNEIDNVMAAIFTGNGDAFTKIMNLVKNIIERYTMFNLE